MEFDIYKNKPLSVEAIYYDGTEQNAKQLCQLAPEGFVIGEDEDGNFSGLFIAVPNLGIMPVKGGDIVYRELKGGNRQFCSMEADGFNKYFKKQPKLVIPETSGDNE